MGLLNWIVPAGYSLYSMSHNWTGARLIWLAFAETGLFP